MYDLDQWQNEVQRRLRRFIRKPRHEPALWGTTSVFYYLASRILEPFFEAYANDPIQSILTLSQADRGPGTKFLVRNAPWLRYQQQRLWRELRRSAALRATLEQLLLKLGVIDYLKHELADTHGEWFRTILQQELDKLCLRNELADLRSLLQEPPWQARYTSIQALGARNGRYSMADLAQLEGALEDTSANVRSAAARQIGHLQGALPQPIRDTLFRLALHDRDLGTRYAAARAIGLLREQLADDASRELLTTALFDEDSFVRSAAGLVLAQLGAAIATPTLVESLILVLRDSDMYAREAAAGALSEMGEIAATKATMAALTEALLDTDYYVHEAVLNALAKLRAMQPATRNRAPALAGS